MAKLVKVKLLKGCEHGKVGDVVEVPEPVAVWLTRERKFYNGREDVAFRVAKPADEPDAALAPTTQAGMKAAGKKNVVTTPPQFDPEFGPPPTTGAMDEPPAADAAGAKAPKAAQLNGKAPKATKAPKAGKKAPADAPTPPAA